jgi:hypothetical protein
MSQDVSGREVRAMSSNGPTGHPLDLVRSALDVAELLVQHVIRPAQQQAHPPDFTREIGEVAMLLRLADRVLVRDADQGRIAVLAWRISRIARSRSNRAVVAARPSRAAAHVLAHGCLHQLGCRDDGFDALARAALASTASNASERVPFRLLDMAWVRHLMLGDQELDHPALELSPVGVGVDLVRTTAEDAYAFSHALRYATDFGRRALPPSVDTAWLSDVTDALVLKALHEDDLDLLGELLMAPALLRRDWTPVQWFGWRVLCDTWARYGFVPGPELPPPVEGEDAVETVRRVLGTGYHTTLVGGLAVATLVSTGHLPASAPPAGPQCEAPFVDPEDDSRAWLRIWHTLYLDERQALGAVPAGIALHRAVDDTDVVAIVDSLNGPSAGALPEPLVTQAAELVNRLALLVGA